ncbi:LAME_0A03268g1_1 [Lachancea meyersii CBS 8951]|uniref:LAME_0A03268g1_1 n=1 Tax=Lachancea meyersii CBS 8951 TaxID=1266667 RepID=A0A1G4INM4_9SACH|nr:LAME_0A03268g1_1 [Lachancea meyersii CBS 8951]
MSDNGSSSSSPFLRKRGTAKGTGRVSNNAETRVFGPKFRSQFAVPKGKQISLLAFVLSGIAVVITASLMFLLGVNIVIQYRTIVPEDRSGLVRKACYIVLSASAIFYMNKFNYWFYRRMTTYFTSSKYQELPSEENFEMSSHA